MAGCGSEDLSQGGKAGRHGIVEDLQLGPATWQVEAGRDVAHLAVGQAANPSGHRKDHRVHNDRDDFRRHPLELVPLAGSRVLRLRRSRSCPRRCPSRSVTVCLSFKFAARTLLSRRVPNFPTCFSESLERRPVSDRARELFDSYVTNSLNHPDLQGIGIMSHVFNLTAAAIDAHIPTAEIIAEVGPLARALSLRTIQVCPPDPKAPSDPLT
ncbi:hypothetical protein ACVWWD_006097 [Mesorhizobium sp. URHB0026]